MSHYPFEIIEKKWQKVWFNQKTFATQTDQSKPKYYILDMFPYPSGAGLHVGHPLGYIASDILARYKRHKGFNVLHPMGYDSFGLPAEQYAIQTGQHPSITTKNNIDRYREQLDAIGLSFDWTREISTCEPGYYKFTQQVFIKLFNHWFDVKEKKARPIEELKNIFSQEGSFAAHAACSCEKIFSANEWKSMPEHEQENILQRYRLAYLADSWVNWCPALGTVLANDEVKEGLSARGGHPVEQKKMKQWQLRITAYAQRLLAGLNELDWPDAVKEMQRNWIGKSEGAEINFKIERGDQILTIYTTRPDTIFGVSFMVLAPEHEMVEKIVALEQKMIVQDYVLQTKKKTERERIAQAKTMTGVFTGAYALHPFTQEKIPVWISDYVLAGYGTGAIMAVAAHDQRDYTFAKTYSLPIRPILVGAEISEAAVETKDGTLINSKFLDGLPVAVAITKIISEIEKLGIGKRQINYKLRDAIFSRQRYWGEPIPVYFENGLPKTLNENELPLILPNIQTYLPTESGEPPLARAKDWKPDKGEHYEYSTMPGFAGSSAYYLRYMDPNNEQELVSKSANHYWGQVDFYIGGSEHATGHLLYSRFWNQFLFDLGMVENQEPFKKLFNQGMILGRSNFVYRKKGTNTFITFSKKDQFEVQPIYVDVKWVKNDILDIEAFKKWRDEFATAEFIFNENGQYECGVAIEKMSKSFYNVVNPDDIIKEYGADAFRLYEMFLGPVEQSKPWNTNGLEGVFRFMNKLWKLYFTEENQLRVTNNIPTKEELKILHAAIKKVTNDLETFTLNTSISALMICVNELSRLQTSSREILQPLALVLSPFAPHTAEELWFSLGHTQTIAYHPFPPFNEQFLIESEVEYAISFNGKVRYTLSLPTDLTAAQIEGIVMENAQTKKWLDKLTVKKVIVVPKKIVNIVC